jgi:glycosyltransferase involved in cell wall biosynthesis
MYWLGKALVQLGHKVTLIARADSCIPGAELRPLANPDPRDGSWVRLIPDSTDILHLRNPPPAALPRPFVITIGGNGQPGQRFHANTIFISRRHAAHHQSAHYVYNGLDPSEYDCSETREPYAVFLAKASWDVKNLRGAIQVCRDAGMELHVIGSRNWPFGLHRLLPPIRGVHYRGMLGQHGKTRLLSRARCLVFPVRWHEPFGNAVTEALASGCFVAATPYGSLPEILTPETGVLSARASELAEVLRHPGRFQPRACRQRVLAGQFTHLDMARDYIAYYERVLTHGRLGEKEEPPPQTVPGFFANQLLQWEN